MAGSQRDADLAVLLHAADARAMPGAWVDDHKGRLGRIRGRPFGRNDPDEEIVDRPWQGAAVEDRLEGEAQHVGNVLRTPLDEGVPAFTQGIETQDGSLPGVDPVFLEEVERRSDRHWALPEIGPHTRKWSRPEP